MSTKYTIKTINTDHKKATIELEDGTVTDFVLNKDWTAADLDNVVYEWAKSLGVPSFMAENAERTYAEKPDEQLSDKEEDGCARQQRDDLLAKTDIWMFPDRQALLTDAEKTSLTAYRKELRELPAAGTSKWNPSVAVDGDKLTLSGVTWPTNVELALDTKYKDK